MLNVNTKSVEEIIESVADELIVPRFGKLSDEDITLKKVDDPVTKADKEAEKALSERLLALLPGSKVVGEEAFAVNPAIGDVFLSDSPVWIIDPIDGTKLFIAKKPFYGVIVALAKQNQTIAGWLYDPTSREFITAEKGAGAWHKGKRLTVLPPPCEAAAMRGVLGGKIFQAFKANGRPLKAGSGRPCVFRASSACHDYARLVTDETAFSGRKDQTHFMAWLDFCSPWDNAAGVLIHTEAGGHTAHWDGQPFGPSHTGRGLMSAPDKASWLALRSWIATGCPSVGM